MDFYYILLLSVVGFLCLVLSFLFYVYREQPKSDDCHNDIDNTLNQRTIEPLYISTSYKYSNRRKYGGRKKISSDCILDF